MNKKTVKCIACKGKGYVLKSIPHGRLDEFEKKEILVLYRKGLGIREIQRELNIKNPCSVSYYIKNCNKK